jgi:argininosuccinate lyase
MNKLVLQGTPLRDAYKKIGTDIENNSFAYNAQVNHTHEGSIGNLQNTAIQKMMDEIIERFNFNKVNSALQKLLE